MVCNSLQTTSKYGCVISLPSRNFICVIHIHHSDLVGGIVLVVK